MIVNIVKWGTNMILSERAKQISPSPTLAITAKAKEMRAQGLDVVGFGAGEPDFNTPQHIIDAAIEAMNKGYTKYTPTGGIPELKQAIAEKFAQDNRLTYESDEITVTTGAKHALYNLFQVLCQPGDEVIIPVPYWVSYPEQVKLAGATPVFLEGKEENGFKITPDQLEAAITPRTKIFLLNSPSNPTGVLYTRDELAALGDVCLRHQLVIISDEIYEKLLYDNAEHVSIASLSPELKANTIVVNGVSKPYAMTGWRIGYAAGPKNVIKAMEKLASHSTSNPTSIAQYAALAALRGPQEPLEEMRLHFDRRRQTMLAWIERIPRLRALRPQGAFYVYVNIRDAYTTPHGTFSDADEWAQALLEKEKVAVVPGSGFGTKDHIRLSYATSLEQIEKGMERIARFVQG